MLVCYPLQVTTEEQLEEGEVDWDTEWVNDGTGASQEVEWFVEDEDEESADEVHSLCRASSPRLTHCSGSMRRRCPVIDGKFKTVMYMRMSGSDCI